MLQGIEKSRPVFSLSDEPCLAYMYADDEKHTIYLGEDFWTASDVPRSKDSKAGTIFHELTKFKDILGTVCDFD